MRRFYVFLLCSLAIPVFAQQDTPRVEVFGGYSYLNADTSPLPRVNVNGGDASFVVNLNQWAGAETNFSAYYKTETLLPACPDCFFATPPIKGHFHDFAVVFGPRIRYKWAFVHTLFGLDDLGGSVLGISSTNGSFAGALGGGALFKFSRYVGLEGSADYAFSRHNLYGGSAVTQNNFRVSVGIVLTFGHVGEIAPVSPTQRQPGTRVARGAGMSIASLGVIVASSDGSGGARIVEVGPNSVAELAGIHAEDIVNSVNGAQIKTPMELAAALAGLPPGTQVRIGYLIRGQWQSEALIILR